MFYVCLRVFLLVWQRAVLVVYHLDLAHTLPDHIVALLFELLIIGTLRGSCGQIFPLFLDFSCPLSLS